MAVALTADASVEKLNARFRATHSKDDTLFYEDDEDLILGLMPRDAETIEYVNAYAVQTGLSRYYGIGYERGSALKIITQLEWLRAQPEVIEVYYGGDTSDWPSLWTKEDSAKLLWHFFKHGHAPYAPHWAKATWRQAIEQRVGGE